MSAVIMEIGIEKSRGNHWLIWFFCGLLILIFCIFATGQSVTETGRPEATREQGTFGKQLVTSNALRAPAKAREAVENAVKAMANNQPEETEKQLSRALDLYPEYGKALTLRAISKMGTQRSEAIADLENAIHIDPGYGLAYAVLASLYNDSQRYDDALPMIVRAIQLLPSAWAVRYEMARTLFGKHRNAEALREVTDAIQRVSIGGRAAPQSCAALHYLRGQLLIEQDELAGARLEFEQSLKEDPQGNLAKSSSEIIAALESQGIR